MHTYIHMHAHIRVGGWLRGLTSYTPELTSYMPLHSLSRCVHACAQIFKAGSLLYTLLVTQFSVIILSYIYSFLRAYLFVV
jgi:hypothetical protein